MNNSGPGHKTPYHGELWQYAYAAQKLHLLYLKSNRQKTQMYQANFFWQTKAFLARPSAYGPVTERIEPWNCILVFF